MLPELPDMRVETPRYIADMCVPAITHRTTILVIGGGLAGLSAALLAADHADVTLLARLPLSESNSAWAQGGIAAALAPEDTPQSHVADTLIAGAELCDEAAVELLASAAPELMRELASFGVPFARDGADFALGLEGGHSQRRILHVDDATGWAVTQVVAQRVREHPRVRILEGMQVVDLLGAGRCEGALARDAEGGWHRFRAEATILATGGGCALFGLSSNPPAALGEGIAMAYRAGAEVADMEMVQFHPTVFRTRSGQGLLITEAARGEGGRLLTPSGRRFMPDYAERAELAPRDIVTRGIYRAMSEEGCDHVLLDLTHLPQSFVYNHFPTITARLRDEGLDLAHDLIPIAPAAHYLMGGIRTDLDGATSLPGLYAAGECACTGVHGANRLASNSLLECLVFGRRAAEAAISSRQLAVGSWQLAASVGPQHAAPYSRVTVSPRQSAVGSWRSNLAAIMTTYTGPIRTEEGLAKGLGLIEELAESLEVADEGERYTAANALLAARLIVASALLRRESRGGHCRSDFPATLAAWQEHIVFAIGHAPTLAESIAVSDAVCCV